MSPHELRESLVFQMIQFLSAPFLAVVTYYMLKPDTTAATVTLAFAAGFASETILLWVRGAINKLKPAGIESVPKGNVVGTIDELRDASAADAETAVTVSILGQADLPVVFKDDGLFIINGVATGDWAIEAILHTRDGRSSKPIVIS